MDIVSDDIIKGEQRKKIRDKSYLATLPTTKGIIDISKEIILEMKLGLNINALVMKDYPCVLSLGQRCLAEGYKCVWEPFQNPVCTAPDGQDIPMDIRSLVSFIKPSHVLPIVPDDAADGKPPSEQKSAAEEKQAREDNKSRIKREATFVGSSSSSSDSKERGQTQVLPSHLSHRR